MQKWGILFIVLLIIILTVIIIFNVKVETDYVPELEIEEKDYRKTSVNLYFKNGESSDLVKESKLIDSKELLLDPYTTLVNLLINGPENDLYQKSIPESLKLEKCEYLNGCVTVFLKNTTNDELKEDDEKIVQEAIEKTLKELTEVNCVNVVFTTSL